MPPVGPARLLVEFFPLPRRSLQSADGYVLREEWAVELLARLVAVLAGDGARQDEPLLESLAVDLDVCRLLLEPLEDAGLTPLQRDFDHVFALGRFDPSAEALLLGLTQAVLETFNELATNEVLAPKQQIELLTGFRVGVALFRTTDEGVSR